MNLAESLVDLLCHDRVAFMFFGGPLVSPSRSLGGAHGAQAGLVDPFAGLVLAYSSSLPTRVFDDTHHARHDGPLYRGFSGEWVAAMCGLVGPVPRVSLLVQAPTCLETPTAVGPGEAAAGSGDHVVQFYERDSALARLVGGYLAGAVKAGGVAIAIATGAHRRAFALRLAAAGLAPVHDDCEPAVVWLDAAEVLATFMPADRIDAQAFRHEVGSALAAAAASGRPVYVYGEMVELLWEAGKVVAALELEELWNAVVREHHCFLMCAYRSSLVSGPEHAEAVQRVCQLHSAVLPPLVGEHLETTEGRRSKLAALYRHVADTIERSAELAERHARYELDHGRRSSADTELERAKRARAFADRGRELASRLERR